ncbi:pre-rRNA-processing protein TSR2 [Dothidotthia symphoricarpi CBS 119687]|uniref:Pre-rRNA-processing protein TSR2 n=1 Tax=Dothidotthia symphoricarpi CBS 119687 TaxID=1392245 RepID=A0A6A5ZUX2_9PLEO|nr:pre-rRNA-processing protein TSR2 [Dothidotthia symphoricarpi CBS 119687]KAF2123522.1 pre-rRNA-processing protein TSR2 [Dothidotthia symphoricarpi CBS 119687]
MNFGDFIDKPPPNFCVANSPGARNQDAKMSTSSTTAMTPEQLQAKFDLGIWYTLFNWPILTVAIKNQWGGPDSADKRDWLAGHVSELFAKDAQTDAEDVEVVLLEVLEDEFGIRLEDETEVKVAKEIVGLRKEIGEGNTSTVDALQKKWEARQGKEVATGDVNVRESNQDAEWDSVDEESDEDEDVEMGEAPALVPAKPKVAPEVDDDGFTKVMGKKKR